MVVKIFSLSRYKGKQTFCRSSFVQVFSAAIRGRSWPRWQQRPVCTRWYFYHLSSSCRKISQPVETEQALEVLKITSKQKESLQDKFYLYKRLINLLMKLIFIMKREGGGGSRFIISPQHPSFVLLVGRSVVSSISVSSLQPIVKPIIEVLMDDGRPIGMKSGPQREDMAKCELGGGEWSLKEHCTNQRYFWCSSLS